MPSQAQNAAAPFIVAGLDFAVIDGALLIGVILLLCFRKRVFGPVQDPLSIGNSLKIRGLLSICIILHHLQTAVAHTILLKVFSIAGILSVALFFFYSGYGLMINYCNREQYLKAFFSKRILKIAVPYGIAVLVIFMVNALTGRPYTLQKLYHSFFDGDPMVWYAWYVHTILIFYFLFYVSARLLKKPIYVLIAVFAGTIGYYFAVTSQASWGSWTTNSCFAFGFGMLAAAKGDWFSRRLRPSKKIFFLMLGVSAVCGFAILCEFKNSGFSTKDILQFDMIMDWIMNQPLSVFAMNILCICAVMLFLWVFRRVSLNNRVFLFLGKISFEIYLYHGLVMYLLRNPFTYLQSDGLYSILVLAGSIAIAYLMNKADGFVYQKCCTACTFFSRVFAVTFKPVLKRILFYRLRRSNSVRLRSDALQREARRE